MWPEINKDTVLFCSVLLYYYIVYVHQNEPCLEKMRLIHKCEKLKVRVYYDDINVLYSQIHKVIDDIACLCSLARKFGSYLVSKPEEGFFHGVVQVNEIVFPRHLIEMPCSFCFRRVKRQKNEDADALGISDTQTVETVAIGDVGAEAL